MSDDAEVGNPVVSLADHRDKRTLRINRKPDAPPACRHNNVEVDDEARALVCADCDESLNPMDWAILLAHHGEAAYHHDMNLRAMRHGIEQVIAWEGEVIIRPEHTTLRATGQNGAKLEVVKTGGMGVADRFNRAFEEFCEQFNKWGVGALQYPRFTLQQLRGRAGPGYRVGVSEKNGWHSLGEAKEYGGAIKLVNAEADRRGCKPILETRPQRLWGR